jgi:hypothetical protein
LLFEVEGRTPILNLAAAERALGFSIWLPEALPAGVDEQSRELVIRDGLGSDRELLVTYYERLDTDDPAMVRLTMFANRADIGAGKNATPVTVNGFEVRMQLGEHNGTAELSASVNRPEFGCFLEMAWLTRSPDRFEREEAARRLIASMRPPRR